MGWSSCQHYSIKCSHVLDVLIGNSLHLDVTKHKSKGGSRGAGVRSDPKNPFRSNPSVFLLLLHWEPAAQQVFCAASPSVLGKQPLTWSSRCLEQNCDFGLCAEQTSPSLSHWLSAKLLSSQATAGHLLKFNPSCLD